MSDLLKQARAAAESKQPKKITPTAMRDLCVRHVRAELGVEVDPKTVKATAKKAEFTLDGIDFVYREGGDARIGWVLFVDDKPVRSLAELASIVDG